MSRDENHNGQPSQSEELEKGLVDKYLGTPEPSQPFDQIAADYRREWFRRFRQLREEQKKHK